ncbi:DUF456 domain-containing protein [Calidifontibacter terrae]
MEPVTVLAGAMIVVGILGLILPILPGLLLAEAGVLVWASHQGSTTAWVIFAITVVIALVGWFLQYKLPNRTMRAAGIPAWSRLAGIALAIVGFFVVPFVGLFIGFVLGVYLAEHVRLRNPAAAWTSTKIAVRAVLSSIGIELAAAVIVSLVWVGGLLLTR